MGFFSDLKTLASDMGDIVKDCGREIGGILEDTKQEIKDDPTKFAIDSLKEVGSAAVTVGKFTVKEIIPAALNTINEEHEKTSKRYEKMQKDNN